MSTKIPIDNLYLFDEYILSTDYMKKIFVEKYKIDENKIHVFKNYSFKEYNYSKLFYEDKKSFNNRRKKILFAGSSNHFSRTKKLQGDYLDNVIELMHYIINSEDYELNIIGTVPFFLYDYFDIPKLEYNTIFDVFDESHGISIKKEFKDSIKVLKWTNFNNYMNLLEDINPDIMIASLVENDFNKCKSWIKMIEAYSLPKTLFLGNVFENSPYEHQANNCTMFTEDTNLIDLLSITQDYEKYYNCLENQKKYLEDERLFFSDRIEEYYNILKGC